MTLRLSNRLRGCEIRILVPARAADSRDALGYDYDTAAYRREVMAWFGEPGLPCAWTPVTLSAARVRRIRIPPLSQSVSSPNHWFGCVPASQTKGWGKRTTSRADGQQVQEEGESECRTVTPTPADTRGQLEAPARRPTQGGAPHRGEFLTHPVQANRREGPCW
jgi:hypothetical protein